MKNSSSQILISKAVILTAILYFLVNFKLPAQDIPCNNNNGHKSEENYIQGKVKAKLNSMWGDTIPVNHGVVKLFRVTIPSTDVVIVDSARINPQGNYMLRDFPPGDYYIVAYPDDEDEDYMISFYPSGQIWNTASRVSIAPGQSKICNIVSVKITPPAGSISLQGEIADSNNVNYKLKNSIIVAKSGNEYKGFAVTNNQGKFLIKSLATGNYDITVSRFAYRTSTKNINVSSNSVINFYVGKDTSYLIPVINISSEIKDFRLKQNFPNPFNPATEIQFSLDKGSSVKLTVYSIEGKLIQEVINEYKAAGEYKVNFNGANLASGIYNYILETSNGQRESKIMVLTK